MDFEGGKSQRRINQLYEGVDQFKNLLDTTLNETLKPVSTEPAEKENHDNEVKKLAAAKLGLASVIQAVDAELNPDLERYGFRLGQIPTLDRPGFIEFLERLSRFFKDTEFFAREMRVEPGGPDLNFTRLETKKKKYPIVYNAVERIKNYLEQV